MTYIATFFSHFGAIRFKKLLGDKLKDVVLMPVPRSVSSSCGTCARFECDDIESIDFGGIEEIDKIIEL